MVYSLQLFFDWFDLWMLIFFFYLFQRTSFAIGIQLQFALKFVVPGCKKGTIYIWCQLFYLHTIISWDRRKQIMRLHSLILNIRQIRSRHLSCEFANTLNVLLGCLLVVFMFRDFLTFPKFLLFLNSSMQKWVRCSWGSV